MDWGLGSLFSGLANLTRGPVGRERRRERRNQREYAQNSILWKADQLRALGINPVAMAGMTGPSYKPQQVGGTQNIGKGFGQLANTLINRAVGKKERELSIASTEADIRWKNASADAMSKAEGKSVNSSGVVEIKPSETVSSDDKNVGIEAGAKTGDAASVRSDHTVKIHPNQELAEALESQGWIDSGSDMLNDTITFVQRATNNANVRTKLKSALVRIMKRTGKLKPGETIYWVPIRQRFQVRKYSSLKKYTRRYHRPGKKKTVKSVEEGMKPWGGGIGF